MLNIKLYGYPHSDLILYFGLKAQLISTPPNGWGK